MAVKIRLMRMGKKKQPTYRVVVADARSPRDGRFIEIIGQYRPREEPSLVEIDDEKALDWLRKGAQPTEQVQKLLAATGVWEQFESERGSAVKTKLARRTPGATAPSTEKKPSKKAAARPGRPPPPRQRTGRGRRRRARRTRSRAEPRRRADERRTPMPTTLRRRRVEDERRRRRQRRRRRRGLEDDDEDEDDDEIGAEGNRIVGGRAQAVVEHVARNVAEEPDAVDVETCTSAAARSQLLVHASPADMGRLIGKRGRVVQALRQVDPGRRRAPRASRRPSTSSSSAAAAPARLEVGRIGRPTACGAR